MGTTCEASLEAVRRLASYALGEGNLHIIFGNNGLSGRSATGNYSLIAAATGLSRVHVGKVLKGRVEPSYKTLLLLSEVTGISVGQISEYIQSQKRAA